MCFRLTFEALRSRGLARLPVLLFALLFSLLSQCQPKEALGQTDSRQETSLKQVKPSPSFVLRGTRGQTVRIDAGLSVAPLPIQGGVPWRPLEGRVNLYIAEGNGWKYLGRTFARERVDWNGFDWVRYNFAWASFDWLVPRNQPQGYQRFKFEYSGNDWARPCVGYGNVFIR